MDKQRKTLLCMYVDDFCGIRQESFNFYIKRRYTINKGKISRKSDEEIKDFPNDFWGDNVSAVTLLIGENGAGKTTLMRLLIKWLCQLSAGHIPQEKGALVIGVDDENKVIAFDNGKPWKIEIEKNDQIVRIKNTDKIKEMLKDIRLAYYTDTTTDLELSDTLTPEEFAFLQDDSLLTRLSNSMKSRYEIDSIKDCIKREDFKRQMEFFLYCKNNPNKTKQFLHSKKKENTDIMSEFSIRYMKLTAIKAGDRMGFQRVPDGNGGLIGEAIDLWNMVFADKPNNNLPDIARILLWGLFSGTIVSLLQWERTLPNLQESIVKELIRGSLRAYMGINHGDWNIVFERFFKNMFRDCDRGFNDVHRYEEFRAVWDKQVVDNINSFLETLKKIEKGEFLKKWMLSENTRNTWEFKLEYFNDKNKKNKKSKENKSKSTILHEWESLWECYLAVAHLMPECRFDWKYASSGGKNRSNLYINLFNQCHLVKTFSFRLQRFPIS